MTELTAQQRAEMRAAAEAATQGPWAVRPYKHDDWGFVRAPADDEGFAWLVARALSGRHGDEACFSQHRADGTDPYGANASHIAASCPANVIALLDLCDRLEKERDEIRDTVADPYANGVMPRGGIKHNWWEIAQLQRRELKATRAALAAEREHASALAAALEPFGPINEALEGILWGHLPDSEPAKITRPLGDLRRAASALDAHRAREGGGG